MKKKKIISICIVSLCCILIAVLFVKTEYFQNFLSDFEKCNVNIISKSNTISVKITNKKKLKDFFNSYSSCENGLFSVYQSQNQLQKTKKIIIEFGDTPALSAVVFPNGKTAYTYQITKHNDEETVLYLNPTHNYEDTIDYEDFAFKVLISELEYLFFGRKTRTNHSKNFESIDSIGLSINEK